MRTWRADQEAGARLAGLMVLLTASGVGTLLCERGANRGLSVKACSGEYRYRAVRLADEQFDFGAAEDDALSAGVNETCDDLLVCSAGFVPHDPATQFVVDDAMDHLALWRVGDEDVWPAACRRSR